MHDGLHQRRGCVEQVLAVVEHQQRSLVRQAGHQLVQRRTFTCDLDAERLRHGVRQQAGVGQAGQLDHPGAVRPAAGQRVRRRLRQAALADAARTDDRDEPVHVDQERSACRSASRPYSGGNSLGRLVRSVAGALTVMAAGTGPGGVASGLPFAVPSSAAVNR